MSDTRPAFLTLLRELARCYQAFEAYSAMHVRALGLTPSQFDIVATLGNTEGMSYKALGERTLITKGTLTGVVERLARRKLVQRTPCPVDGRSTIVALTARGDALFRRVFPEHLAHLQHAFGRVPARTLRDTERALAELRGAFAAATGPARERES